ncbi:MAG: GH92 family glycosyl hydrolase [Phycisphaerae bacterium]
MHRNSRKGASMPGVKCRSRVFFALLIGLMMCGTAGADINGFTNTAPANFFHEKQPEIVQGGITLTQGRPHQAASIFCRKRQNIRAFEAGFTYQAKPGRAGMPADGLALVFQNDPRGVKALGGDGGALGYGAPRSAGERGLSPIMHSAAVEFNIFAHTGIGVCVHTQGVTGLYEKISPVNLSSGDPIRVRIHYNGVFISEAFKDLKTGQTSSTRQLVDIPGAVHGNRAYVGFTAASGDGAEIQRVSNFYFVGESPVPWRHSPPVDFVQPLLGTGSGPGSSINLFPGPSLPFGMVQLSPNTEVTGYGYHSFQSHILGFSMTHMSGPGCPNDGEIFFTATTGQVHTRIKNFESRYSHSHERAAAGYYRVDLLRWGVRAALTATTRCGLVQFTFPGGRRANVLVPISETLNYTHASHVHVVGNDEITGFDANHCFCGNSQVYRVYFVMKFSQPFKSFGTWSGPGSGMNGHGILHSGARIATQVDHHQWIGAYVSWPASNAQRVITAKIGISYVSLADAKENLKAEVGDRSFNAVRLAALARWNKALSVIRVHGGTRAHRIEFYTSLYHSMLMPNTASDVNGKYMGFDDRVHRMPSGHVDYMDYSGWDIYRSQMPLLGLIAPSRTADICQSIVLMYKQGGWIGRWPQTHYYTNVMCGSPLTTVMCQAWDEGIHGFDIRAVWPGMVKDATEAPPPGKPYAGEAGIQWINKLHYVPDNYVSYGSVSQIQEDCIAYAAIYHLAKRLGKPNTRHFFLKRALYYRNVFDPADRVFRPRLSNGKWLQPFSRNQYHGFVENSCWDYQWLEPCDMAWVIHAVGRARFNRRLEKFFSYQQPNWYALYYNPYNEPDLEAPFEFDFSGKPWQTQRVVRKVLRQNYTLSYDGVPGNDDCGEMSSWAVMSMMGLYMMDPGKPVMELNSPLFRSIVIHLAAPYAGKEIVIRTNSHPFARRYIHSLTINGHPWNKTYVPVKVLTDGAKLKYRLGSTPDRHWAASPNDAPPSITGR